MGTERLVRAARQKGGERLDLRGGRPAILVSGGRCCQAGKAVVSAEDLEEFIEAAVGAERWVTFELGGEIATTVVLGGESYTVRARREDGQPQVVIDLAPTPSPAASAEPPPPPAPGASDPPPRAVASAPLERPLDRMLCRLVGIGGSDLHPLSSMPPMVRLQGDMAPLPDFAMPLGSEHILLMCDEVAPGDQPRRVSQGPRHRLPTRSPGWRVSESTSSATGTASGLCFARSLIGS